MLGGVLTITTPVFDSLVDTSYNISRTLDDNQLQLLLNHIYCKLYSTTLPKERAKTRLP